MEKNTEKLTLTDVITNQCLHGIYDELNDIESIEVNIETALDIIDTIIFGDDDKINTVNKVQILTLCIKKHLKELNERTDKALKYYYRIREQDNGTEA